MFDLNGFGALLPAGVFTFEPYGVMAGVARVVPCPAGVAGLAGVAVALVPARALPAEEAAPRGAAHGMTGSEEAGQSISP